MNSHLENAYTVLMCIDDTLERDDESSLAILLLVKTPRASLALAYSLGLRKLIVE